MKSSLLPRIGTLILMFAITGCASTSVQQAMERAKDYYNAVTASDHRKEYFSDKPVVLFILDTSESMLHEEKGETRLAIAKRSIIDSISQVNSRRYNTGLITFNSMLDCKADVAVEPGNPDPNNVVRRINALEAHGATPLAEAIALSSKILKNVDKKLVIVFSDGAETCQGNPEAAARQLAQDHGIQLNMQVIGYAVNRQTERKLQRIAQVAPHWGYHRVDNQQGLTQAINNIAVQQGVLDPIWTDVRTSSFEFSPGSTVLSDEYMSILNKLNLFLSNNRKNIVVVGHTDSQGGADYNLELSRQRAMIVKNALVRMGISPTRIATDGKGEFEPVATNATEEGRRQNRRVEIRVLD